MTINEMDNVEKEYTNNEISVVWKPSLCDHSGICISELPDVFNSIKRPWINIYGAPTNAIKRVVDMCPTKALTWFANKNTTQISEKNEIQKYTNISIIKDGPIRVSGNFVITNENGQKINCADKISLCRCTKSKKLPFCDGSHRDK